ncbi:uncharacterized protein MONBRDRAFT_34240 [Monosiga brevicollis MX1]|uniref:RED-like N-terminal domain-containing protein n=1 Tax=Monosiga brevicollis TaxID=81824 RepID=A9VAF5_MONBE|nr:uncharacterized protein MONBRDRAFT_34240 [Monosiga brevicollis MX1]EDQ85476.1 predicted protein [Monosiga brevicollis MX1]|eukprot:XP_001749667.1 hypothetical protein [Monosiga brevicollis MX1]
MSNKDFRQLIMTPRPNRDESPSSQTAKTVDSSKGDATTDKTKPAKKSSWKPRAVRLSAEEEETRKRQAELAAKYRDRAAERRKQEDQEDQATQLHRLIEQSLPTGPPGSEAVVDAKQAMIEQSKYLGGDMEHTHLVKGLDYALLQKNREEAAKTQSQTGEAAEDGTNPDDIQENPLEVKCRTRLARMVLQSAFRHAAPRATNEFFEPGRMAYVLDPRPNRAAPRAVSAVDDVPTTILRSKSDIKQYARKTKSATHDIVVNKLVSIVENIREGKRLRKQKRKDKKRLAESGEEESRDGETGDSGVAPPRKSSLAMPLREKEEDAELDIFADAGDYKPRETKDGLKQRKRRVQFHVTEEHVEAVVTRFEGEASRTAALGPTKPPSEDLENGPAPGPTMPGPTMPGPTMPGPTMPGPSMPGPSMPGAGYPEMPGASYPELPDEHASGYPEMPPEDGELEEQDDEESEEEEDPEQARRDAIQRRAYSNPQAYVQSLLAEMEDGDEDDGPIIDSRAIQRIRADGLTAYDEYTPMGMAGGDSDDERQKDDDEAPAKTRAQFDSDEAYRKYMAEHASKQKRKRRNQTGPDKGQLNRDWQKIQAMWAKEDGEAASKKPKT